MRSRSGRSRAAAALTSVVAAGTAVGAAASGPSPEQDPVPGATAPGTGRPDAVQAELALTAQRARWRPAGGGRGRLVLEDVGPRMTVMALAPRREHAVVPASLLGASWRGLFGSSRAATNVIVSARVGGERRLLALQARLVRHHRSGERYEFAVSGLERGGHRPATLGRRRAVLEDVTVLVDPSVTDAVRALWDALVAFVGPQIWDPAPNPTADTIDGKTVTNGGAFPGLPGGLNVQDPTTWEAAERSALDAVGARLTADFVGRSTLYSTRLDGEAYDQVALFSSQNFDAIIVGGLEGRRTELTNSAIFEVQARSLSFTSAEIGGLNLRATMTPDFVVANTVMKDVDMTGAIFSGGSVSNSVLDTVNSNRRVRGPDQTPDLASDRGFAHFSDMSFTSTLVRDSQLPRAEILQTTFEGCSFLNVDLSRSSIQGSRTLPGMQFEPTFDNSILEATRFDGAQLENVSFAGVDFSGGGVSFDGARLDNVDFTGATGLQYVDWTKVIVDGPVYGLWEVASMLDLQGHPENLRSLTTDGIRPDVDLQTGYDVTPDGLLVDPDTGTRLTRDGDELVPIDPSTGTRLSAADGFPLDWAEGRLLDTRAPEVDYRVEYRTGELAER